MTAGLREPELAHAREVVARLASLDRGSATDGERAAAQIIADELVAMGVPAVIEEERAHGTHWWPYGLPPLAAAAAGAVCLRRRTRASRWVAAAVGVAGAASVAEDISGGPQLLRRLLPARTTVNVVARIGDPRARHHLLVHSHHDAAHGGLTFDPRLAPLFAHGSTLSTFASVLGGPALAAAGALTNRRAATAAGTALSGIAASLFADIALRRTVPGADDNASGVACVLLLAARLRDTVPDGLAITLLCTGSEESWLEGMAAFGQRHFATLPRDATTVICVDQIGWANLTTLESEGVWRPDRTPEDLARLITDCAREIGLELRAGFPGAFPSDALVARRAGYRTATLASVDDARRLPGYHTSRDTPERVEYRTVRDATDLIEAVARRLVA